MPKVIRLEVCSYAVLALGAGAKSAAQAATVTPFKARPASNWVTFATHRSEQSPTYAYEKVLKGNVHQQNVF